MHTVHVRSAPVSMDVESGKVLHHLNLIMGIVAGPSLPLKLEKLCRLIGYFWS